MQISHKVVLVSFSFVRGGAAKAATRFSAIASTFSDVQYLSAESNKGTLSYAFHLLKRLLSYALVFPFQRKYRVKCSANLFSFRPITKRIKRDNSSVFNIHWINNDTISIFALTDLPTFSIITMHDEWLYCGVEHYFDIDRDFFDSPYATMNHDVPQKHISFLHKFVWERKRKAFKGRNDLIVTCPSRWLFDRAKNSWVLKDCEIRVLHNPIDTQVFSPLEQRLVDIKRRNLGIHDRFFVVFGAVGGSSNPLKGFEELEMALAQLAKKAGFKDRLILGVFGGSNSGVKNLQGFPVHEFGFINAETEMAEIYAMADVILVPSKVEAFGQVAAEGQACATPVVAFDTSGIKDVVVPGQTGYLAKPFSPVSLAEQIENVFNCSDDEYRKLCQGARNHVVDNFSYPVIARQYKSIVEQQHIRKTKDTECFSPLS